MTLLFSIPTFETIYPDTFKAVYDLNVSGHEVDFELVRGYIGLDISDMGISIIDEE